MAAEHGPTPNEALARRVAERLVAAGVVSAGGSGALTRQLAAGTMKAHDWQALLDGASPAGGAPGGTAADPDELPF